MTTTTTTLTQFLEQCIAADEAAAQAALGPSGYPLADTSWEETLTYAEMEGVSQPGLDHFATHDPARVLRQCAALRAVVALHEPEEGDYGPGCWVCNDTNYVDGARLSSGWPCDTLKALAGIYADRPGWQEAWA